MTQLVVDFSENEVVDSEYVYSDRPVEKMPDRYLRFGDGKTIGYLGVLLAGIALVIVLCLRFPVYLTTIKLRALYETDGLRLLVKYALYTAIVGSVGNLLVGKRRDLGLVGMGVTALAFGLGGYSVEFNPAESNKLSLGLDWLVIDLVLSVVVFVSLEKTFPKYKDQATLRPEWKMDLIYFSINQIVLTGFLMAGVHIIHTSFSWAVFPDFQAWVRSHSIFVQLLILVIGADFVLYWIHRIFHESPILWKFHAIHHSSEYMDWMAASRNHIFQIFVDRCVAVIPIFLLGADREAVNLYLVVAAFQTVYVHTNIRFSFGPLKYFIATAQFHHWHHSSEAPALDTNYSVHTTVFDFIFGTYHLPGKFWPARYGTVVRLPRGFFKQLLYPFSKS